MSKIQSKLDQKEVSGGKADTAVAASKEKRKNQGTEEVKGEDGEVKLSKKELNKLAKKNQKAAAKAGDPVPPKEKIEKKPKAAKQEAAVSTRPAEVTNTLNRLEKSLAAHQFVGGARPSALDNEEYKNLVAHANSISPSEHPNVFAWWGFISHFADSVRDSWAGAKAAPKAAKQDDDLDLFGDDDEDATAAAAAAKANASAAKKPKKVVIAMSLVMLEVKPLDDTTNLDDLFKRILSTITMEGLFWKTEYKKEPVAFGIFKLIIGFSLEDEKVSVDTVVEQIEELSDMVQSVDIASFNKI